jgi:hypothetical protein
MNKRQFIRVTNVLKRRKRKKKSSSFSKVIPIHNEAKDTIDHSTAPVSPLKISTNSSIHNSLLTTQSITNPRKSTNPSLIVDSVKPPIEKQEK